MKYYYSEVNLPNGQFWGTYISIDWKSRLVNRIDVCDTIRKISGFISKKMNHEKVIDLGYKETTKDVFYQMYEL